MDPIDACMQVFDKAMLQNSNGMLMDTADLEGLQVLQNFFDFHKSWFQIKSFSELPQAYAGGSQFRYDESEDACYLNHLLFSGNNAKPDGSYNGGVSYQNAVSGAYSVRCHRTEPTRILPSGNGAAKKYYTPEYLTNLPWANAPGRGHLVGVTPLPVDDHTYYTRTGRAISSQISYVGGGSSENLDDYIPRNWGAGIIGSASYMMKNGQYAGTSDGAELVRRRIGRNLMEDLLCRQPPFRRVEDVGLQVLQYNLRFTDPPFVAFRRNAKCMSCHSTQDGIAGLYRNLHFVGTQGSIDWNDDGVFGRPDGVSSFNRLKDASDKTYLVRKTDVNLPSEGEPLHLLHPDTKYQRRPPNGHLVYRSYDGSEVNHQIDVSGTSAHPALEGVRALGQLLAQQNDLYVCAAKRYFEFFTGIDANLNDPGDDRNPSLSLADRHYKDLVVQYGLDLKEHQSLRRLVKAIVSSDLYKKIGMRDVK